MIQPALFCACGAVLGSGAGECRACRQRQLDSRRRFGGHREAVVRRDRGRCLACGNTPAHPHVHHRRPGCHDRRWLATLCQRCHARVHKLAALTRGWLPPTLIGLWAEQHPGHPRQLQFDWEIA